jgi:hypothetical protein
MTSARAYGSCESGALMIGLLNDAHQFEGAGHVCDFGLFTSELVLQVSTYSPLSLVLDY